MTEGKESGLTMVTLHAKQRCSSAFGIKQFHFKQMLLSTGLKHRVKCTCYMYGKLIK